MSQSITPTSDADGAIAPTLPSLGISEFIQETSALTRRLFIQLQRRPTTLVAGVIQPLMWLILFGALFQNVPEGLFGESQNYGQFLGAGIIVFTAFAGALNAGLPVMFDREFGFLKPAASCAFGLPIFDCDCFGAVYRHYELGSNHRNCGLECGVGGGLARPRRTAASDADCANAGTGRDGTELGACLCAARSH